MSAEGVEVLSARFEAEFQRLYAEAQTTDENFPGGIAAYALPDGRTFAAAVGHSDVDDQIPMTAEMRMPSGSIGKTYAAAVALQLAQQGRLDLDTPISTWLGDEAWFSRVPNAEDLTLRILLSHTGGLIDHAFDSPEFRTWAIESINNGDHNEYLEPRELMAFVLDREPLFAVGEGYNYTDTGYVLAGIAMEEATGSSYYQLLDELFLEPLEFEYTLPADRRDLPGLAQGYAHASQQIFGSPLEVVQNGELVLHPLVEYTGGGLVNNPQDLVRWAQLLFRGEAITGDDLPELLKIGFPSDPSDANTGYGLGVFVDHTEYGPRYAHGGFFPGFSSSMAYYPHYDLAISVQVNSDDSPVRRYTEALVSVLLEGVAPIEESGKSEP